MQQIMERLLGFHGEFDVIYFGDEVIHNAPVESWPLCDWCDSAAWLCALLCADAALR